MCTCIDPSRQLSYQKICYHTRLILVCFYEIKKMRQRQRQRVYNLIQRKMIDIVSWLTKSLLSQSLQNTFYLLAAYFVLESPSLIRNILFHYNNNRHMSAGLQNLKQELKLDAVLVTDSKGFEIHNSGFTHTHHLHALKQLSKYFFPNEQGTVVGIQTDQFTIVMKDTSQGNMVATRELK